MYFAFMRLIVILCLKTPDMNITLTASPDKYCQKQHSLFEKHPSTPPKAFFFATVSRRFPDALSVLYLPAGIFYTRRQSNPD
jgi:hypothetical protein